MNSTTVNAEHPGGLKALFAALFVVSVSSSAFGQSNAIATISAVSGQVQVIGTSGTQQALKGIQLRESDAIKTAKGGIAQVKFNDGSSFTIYEQSSIRIEQYKKRAAGGFGVAETAFDVLNGKLKFFVNPKAKDKATTKFRSKTAVMGIRGTSGIISVAPDGSTQLVVLTGLVEVKNPKIPEFSVSVAPNFSTKINPTAAPEKPIPISQDTVKNLLPEVPQGNGFSEDGPSSVSPQPGEAPLRNEQNQNDKPTNDKSSGAAEPDAQKNDERQSAKPTGNRTPVQSKPIFAPGGVVLNRDNESKIDGNVSSLGTKGPLLGNNPGSARDPLSSADTAQEGLPLERQQSAIPFGTILPVRVVEQVQKEVERTIDDAQTRVQERVVETQPVKQPQKVKVNIALPAD